MATITRERPNADLVRRIERGLKNQGLSAGAACERAGLDRDAIRNIKRGHEPRAGTVEALDRVLHLSDIHFGGQRKTRESIPPDGYTAVSTVSIRGGMGGGGYSTEDLRGPPEFLPTQLIRNELRGTAADFLLMELEGQSMDPILVSGDRVLIDTRKTNPSQPGIFVLWDGFGFVAKWVERVDESDPPRIKVTSENPRFAPYERVADEAHIIGRVVWFARRL